jgi:hypothetical protein
MTIQKYDKGKILKKMEWREGGREGWKEGEEGAFPSSTHLHFVNAMVSGHLIGSDDKVLLLDGQGLVAEGGIVAHLTLGVEAVEV